VRGRPGVFLLLSRVSNLPARPFHTPHRSQHKREIRLMGILQFVSTTVWKSLFGKPADSLERSLDHPDEYMIIDYSPLTSRYACVPPDFGPSLSIDAYISGIIAGVLQGADFPARVTAHTVTLEEGETPPNEISSAANTKGGGVGLDGIGSEWIPPRQDKAVFLVKFAPSVLARDETLG
jgi:trafficking protein particle complex subunit 5